MMQLFLVLVLLVWNVKSLCYKGNRTGSGFAVVNGKRYDYIIFNNNHWVYECDQIIGNVKAGLLFGELKYSNKLVRRLSPVANENTLQWIWPMDNDVIIVPYILSQEIIEKADTFKIPFEAAIVELDSKTNIRIIPYVEPDNADCVEQTDANENCRDWAMHGECITNPDYMLSHCQTSCDICNEGQNHYVEIVSDESNCWSQLGRQETVYKGSHQEISIGVGCEHIGVIIHEFLHALGFSHHQNRDDRDGYIVVHFENIDEWWKQWYHKKNNMQFDDCGYYDYNSIMHYTGIQDNKIIMEPLNKVHCTPDTDKHQSCQYWASIGECINNPGYMLINCQTSCDSCMGVGSHGELTQEDLNCINYIYKPNTIPIRFISSNYDNYWIRHLNSELYISQNKGIFTYFTDSTFILKEPGLAGNGMVSFESSNYPGYYISVIGNNQLDIVLNPNSNDASFYIKTALNKRIGYSSLESKSFPNYYIRHNNNNYRLSIGNREYNQLFIDDASFKIDCTFSHKSSYTNTCPTETYSYLNNPQELYCNRAPLYGQYSKNQTIRFQFNNHKIRDVIFTTCESGFDTKLRLFSSDGITQITSNPNCDDNDCTLTDYPCYNAVRQTIKFPNLDVATYYLELDGQRYSDGLLSGHQNVAFYKIQAYCPDDILLVSGGAVTGTIDDKPDIKIFTLTSNTEESVIITDCDSDFNTNLFLYDRNMAIISSDHCVDNNDCDFRYNYCSKSEKEAFSMKLTANTLYFVAVTADSVGGNYNVKIEECVEAADSNVNCAWWASIGECVKNPGYMLPNCQTSCDICNEKECIEVVDTNDNCEHWASIGECTKNPDYMLHYCQTSCNICNDN